MMTESNKKSTTKSWKGMHTISVDQLSKVAVEELFTCAKQMKAYVNGELEASLSAKYRECCKGKVLACAFYEASTRTNCSFTAAMERLGGSVLQVNSTASSVKKGESLSDTMICLSCYSDILVLRHPSKGSAREASSALKKPLINAGDGTGEHPTQALLDLFTIQEEQGKIDSLEITILGDLKYGRTTHSLAKLLSRYRIRLNLVSPKGLEMPNSVKDVIPDGILLCETTKLEDVLQTTDVLYVTRIQKERFSSEEEYNNVKDAFIVDAKLLQGAKKTATVMHPLPRVNEISTDVDDDPRAAYFRQMENGMIVRMALIALTLDVL